MSPHNPHTRASARAHTHTCTLSRIYTMLGHRSVWSQRALCAIFSATEKSFPSGLVCFPTRSPCFQLNYYARTHTHTHPPPQKQTRTHPHPHPHTPLFLNLNPMNGQSLIITIITFAIANPTADQSAKRTLSLAPTADQNERFPSTNPPFSHRNFVRPGSKTSQHTRARTHTHTIPCSVTGTL